MSQAILQNRNKSQETHPNFKAPTSCPQSSGANKTPNDERSVAIARIAPFRTTFVRADDLAPNGERGPWGDKAWQGNVSGYVVGAFLKTYHRDGGLFIDPMEGSGTSRDVARDLNIRYRGFDLHDGFDASIVRSLAAVLESEKASTAFIHPPYLSMKQYLVDNRDLSSVGVDVERWTEKMRLVLRNVWAVLEDGGHVGVLVGDVQKDGRFYDLAARVSMIAPQFIAKKVIREQTNVTSSRTVYSGSFVATTHETLIVFKKRRVLSGASRVAA